MRFLLAPNAFKECLSAGDVADAIATGLKRADPQSSIDRMPLADGGPGMLDALHLKLKGRWRRLRVHDPLGRPCHARWLFLPNKIALLESAQALGLELVVSKHRDAVGASSEGVGQLLLAAKRAGAKEAWVGLGGTATSDGGCGMARALGWKFLDSRGKALAPGAGALKALARVVPPVHDRLKGMRIKVLCDVTNPLLGERGAARVFAPQKGANAAQVRAIEKGLETLARRLAGNSHLVAGSGAAGGLGYGLLAFAGARLDAGAETLMELCGFAGSLRRCDWVISGEGRLDAQSASGKLPVAVSLAARKMGKACLLMAGQVQGNLAQWRRYGATRVVSLQQPGMSRRTSMRLASKLLASAAEEFARSLARA